MKFYKFLWVILQGLELFLESIVLGIISFASLIGIPFAKIWFGLSKMALNPFDKEIDVSFSSNKFLNLLWLLTFGWFFVFGCYLFGIICYASIIFIPFGKQYFKIGKYFTSPFGADIT